MELIITSILTISSILSLSLFIYLIIQNIKLRNEYKNLKDNK